MAKKTVVVDLDLNGNKISKAVIDSTGQASYGGIKYNSNFETIDVYTDSDAWEHLITQSTYDELSNQVTNIQTSLTDSGSVGSKIKANTDFREGKSTLTAALTSTQTYEGLEIDLNGNSIILSWKGNTISSFDASSFIIDGMVTGAHVITYNTSGYSYEGGAIVIGTTVIDGKTVTNDSTEHSMPTGATYGKYLRMVLSSDPVTAVWVNLQDLVDIYTAGDGLDLNGGQFSVKLKTGSGSVNTSGLAFENDGSMGVELQGAGGIGMSTTSDNRGLYVKVDGTTITKDASTGALSAASTISQTTNTVAKSAGEKVVTLSGNKTIISARLYDATNYDEVVCVIKTAPYNASSGNTVVTFQWNGTGLSGNFIYTVTYK